jgi:hypothetical protein
MWIRPFRSWRHRGRSGEGGDVENNAGLVTAAYEKLSRQGKQKVDDMKQNVV